MEDILTGKKIVVGITGCIAAYKSAYLVRELKKRGAEVKVLMTPSAVQFIAPLTLSSLSGNKVIVNMFPDDQKSGTSLSTWHIDYALWADLMIIAPATVNTAAKIAHGFADNALTSLVLALRSPLIIAPAADVDMYDNKITQQNFLKLEELGHFLVHAETGELASGLEGRGRFADINKITDAAEIILSGYSKDLKGKKILITAGPTFEDIDPVRFIGNRSSGKMGYAIAKSAYLRGAEVTLISGPSSETVYQEIKLLKVRSAEEMLQSVKEEFTGNDILIMSAAVADYKPAEPASRKIKKEDKLSSIKLSETADILRSLDKCDKVIAGFALETDNEIQNAQKKLLDKNLDLIIMNSLKDTESGFEFDTNKISVLHKNGSREDFPLMSKFAAANLILSEILKVK
jgi:phosphopantothenoylcysteine decarboxylase / phosphopantothenate---cysteine ligase